MIDLNIIVYVLATTKSVVVIERAEYEEGAVTAHAMY
jgi:hypothetical protein